MLRNLLDLVVIVLFFFLLFLLLPRLLPPPLPIGQRSVLQLRRGRDQAVGGRRAHWSSVDCGSGRDASGRRRDEAVGRVDGSGGLGRDALGGLGSDEGGRGLKGSGVSLRSHWDTLDYGSREIVLVCNARNQFAIGKKREDYGTWSANMPAPAEDPGVLDADEAWLMGVIWKPTGSGLSRARKFTVNP